jgi:hypothetical protein
MLFSALNSLLCLSSEFYTCVKMRQEKHHEGEFMCRNTLFSILLFFAVTFAWLGSSVIQEAPRTVGPFDLTATSIIATATAQAQLTNEPQTLSDVQLTSTALAEIFMVSPTSEPQTAGPFELTATSIIQTATAQAQASDEPQTAGSFELTATSIIQTATAQAQARPTQIIDPFDLTATSIVATATANAQGANPQPSIDPFQLTATAIIKQATLQAATQAR